MKLETLSSFALARMLSDCADGSAMQRKIQEELRSREQHLKATGDKTPWLFPKEELKATRKQWGPKE